MQTAVIQVFCLFFYAMKMFSYFFFQSIDLKYDT